VPTERKLPGGAARRSEATCAQNVATKEESAKARVGNHYALAVHVMLALLTLLNLQCYVNFSLQAMKKKEEEQAKKDEEQAKKGEEQAKKEKEEVEEAKQVCSTHVLEAQKKEAKRQQRGVNTNGVGVAQQKASTNNVGLTTTTNRTNFESCKKVVTSL